MANKKLSRQVLRAMARRESKALVSAEKQKKRKWKMNPVRKALLDKMQIAYLAHEQREDVGDMRHFHQVVDMNQEFVDRGRGKGKGRGFIKSVALQRDNTTYFPPDKRNGQRECSRRAAQA